MSVVKLYILLAAIFEVVKVDKIEELNQTLTIKYDELKTQFEDQLNILRQKIDNQTNEKSSCGSGWISYSDLKCFKILGKKGTELEGKANCSQMDASSTLITIQSKKENDFLYNLLKKFKSISDFVWIGLELVNNSFKWMDGTELKYENWGENKEGNNKCVQMSLAQSEEGKWTDEPCHKKYLFVCQKKQSTKTVLSQEFENMTKVIEKQQKSIEKLNNESQDLKNIIAKQQVQINSLIPLGFLYTQLPNQTSPSNLWPHMKWAEVTQQYAGLFFRAEGGGSQPFGINQAANQSWISSIKANGYYFDNWNGAHQNSHKDYEISNGEWKSIYPGWAIYNIEIFSTDGEVRPLNTAIKIWKRIE